MIIHIINESSNFISIIADYFNDYFPKYNQLIISLLITIYVFYQILKAITIFSNAKIVKDERIKNYIDTIPLKRKVKVLVNDNIKQPITFGLVYPKIVIQTKILEDNKLLKYVIIHEMIHIKKCDVLYNHFKYIIACIFWYNPAIWAMTIYLDEDLEILCDKLVVEKTGNNDKSKKNYSEVMLELMTSNAHNQENVHTKKKIFKKEKGVLKLHPNVERMIILKNWKIKKIGIALFTMMILVTTSSFASIEERQKTQTRENMNYIQSEEQLINEDNRTQEITDEEYKSLVDLEGVPLEVIANINENNTLKAYGGSTSYKFRMESWTEADHKRFVTQIRNTKSKGNIDYKVIIEESGEVVYSKNFSGDVTLTTTGARGARKYVVTVINNSNKPLDYDISIQSYRR